MARVDLVEPYAIRNARKAVRESLMAHGEEVIGLHMFHVDPDERERHPRCVCFDDVYQQGETATCGQCFGTTFSGGIKEMSRMWGMFTQTPNSEDVRKRGVYISEKRQVQLEWNPLLRENDFVLRVKRWTPDHRPIEVSHAFQLETMNEDSLRTGNQFVQTGMDRVGQRGNANALPRDHVIYKVLTEGIVSPDFPVARLDGAQR